MLDAESARTGRSIAALIRDAVDVAYGSQRSADDDLDAMHNAFGSWQARDVDGTEWVDRMRSGRRVQDVR